MILRYGKVDVMLNRQSKIDNRQSVVRRSLRPTPFAPRPTAFTLVELLVVIAIMSLLLSILLPSLNQAQELAQRVLCASQLKQIGVAYIAYTNDYRRYFPIVYRADPLEIWTKALGNPYLDFNEEGSSLIWAIEGNESIFSCPSQLALHSVSSKRSYGQNLFTGTYRASTTTIKKTTDAEKPEETCLTADGYFTGSFWAAHIAYSYLPEAPHSEGTNILMCDFSVQWWLGDDVPCSAHGSTSAEINRFWRGY